MRPTLRARAVALPAALLGVGLVPSAAQPPKRVAATIVVSVSVAKLWGHPAFAAVKEARGRVEFGWLVHGLIGFTPAELDRVAVFWTGGKERRGPFVLASTREPHDAAAVAAGLPRADRKAGTKALAGGLFAAPGAEFPLALRVNDRTLLFAPEGDAKALSAFATELRRDAAGPALVARIDAPALTALLEPVAKSHAALLAATSARLTADPTGDAKAAVELALTFPTPADAARAAPVLRAAFQELASWTAARQKRFADVPYEHGAPGPLLEWIGKTLTAATVRTAGVTVTATAEVEPADAVSRVLAAVPDSVLAGAGEPPGANNLRQIVLAHMNSADTFAGQCPGNTYTKDGKPLLSWRVHLLPFIEQEALFKQFKLDEPWDSDHNKKLADAVVPVYAIPGRPAPRGETYFRCFIGPKNVMPQYRPWLIEGTPSGPKFPASITDGSSNTLLVVEASESVVWTKPDDLVYDGVRPVPPLGGPGGRFLAGLGDGSVRTLNRTKLGEPTLRAIITIMGGETVGVLP